jgi:hypothetical protein
VICAGLASHAVRTCQAPGSSGSGFSTTGQDASAVRRADHQNGAVDARARVADHDPIAVVDPMRPSKRTLERLRERARLLGEKHTTLAERCLEEGVIMDEHPNIHFVDGALGRRPAVLGSGLDAWEIVEVAKDNSGSVADTASYLELDPRLVQTALRYYGANRDEIDDWIERMHTLNEREESTWHAAHEAISA